MKYLKFILISIFFIQGYSQTEWKDWKQWNKFVKKKVTTAAVTDIDSTIIDTIGAGRTYETITAWIESYDGDSLTVRKIIPKGVLVDSLYEISSAIEVSTSTITDSSYYFWLVAAPQSKHTGTAGTGVRIRHTGSDNYAMYFLWDMVIEGIEWDGYSNDYADGMILINNNILTGRHRFEIKDCIIHNTEFYDGTAVDFQSAMVYVYMRLGTVKVYNNIFYDFSDSGALTAVDMQYAALYVKGLTPKVHIYNNTFAGIGYGDDLLPYGVYLSPTTSMLAYLRNNVVSNLYANSPDTAYGYTSKVTLTASNNASDNVYCVGSDSVTNLAGTAFTDTASYDFSLKANSPLIDTGYSNLGTPYNLDILGVDRYSYSPWDIGAYECTSGCTAPIPTPYLVYNVGKYNVGVYNK